jgi:hypothetical protein
MPAGIVREEIFMKKRMVFMGIALLFILGCASNPVATNSMTKNANADNFCVLSFHWYILRIELNGKSYNGVPLVPQWFGQRSKVFIIPPGNYTVKVYFKTGDQGEYYVSQLFEDDFENGHYYYFIPLLDQFRNERTFLYDETDPSIWTGRKLPGISTLTGVSDPVLQAQIRIKNVEKKLGIK